MKKVLIVFLVIGLAAGGYWFYMNRQDPSISEMPKVTATIKDREFSLYAPDTDEGLQKGLSVFNKLPENEGMVFQGLPVGVQTFWMKDMKFDIDIIWVNKDNEVVHIVYEASKDSYPTRFENSASQPSAYVIEINAGLAEKYGIAPGSTVSIR